MSGRPTTTLFRTLFREEWRLHAELFGGRRFLAFPFVLAILVAGAVAGLSVTGTEQDSIATGLHVIVLAFGVYSGTAGFVGSDMLEDAFGSLSLVLSSSTTLPLSRRELLGVFLVKDALYYGLLFVLPMAVGAGSLWGLSRATPIAIAWLWLSLFSLFVTGMVLTVTGIAIRTRGVPGWVLLATGALTAGGLWTTEYLGPVSRWVFTAGQSLHSVVILALVSVGVGAVALRLYEPTYSQPTKTATDRFTGLDRRLSSVGDEDGLVTKTLLELGRSSGGYWKPVVSAGVLLVLVAFLVGVVHQITGIEPAPGIFFGGVLGLSAFTTYNWVTQFDSIEEYLTYPIGVDAVFRAKWRVFVLVNTPAVALPYVGAVVWFDATALDALVGAVVLAGYSTYYYGLTVYLAGFDPNEFLFDAVRFAAFTVGVAVVLVPTLVVGFVGVSLTPVVVLTLGLSSVVVGIVGYGLTRRAGPRWEAIYLRG